MCRKCLDFTHGSGPVLNRWPLVLWSLTNNIQEYTKDMCFLPHFVQFPEYTLNLRSKYFCEVLVPSLLSDLEPMQRQGSLLQWLLLAHFVPVPADCVCRWADWRWSPLHGSSEQGLHHPVCPDDPPFETGRTRGIEEWGVRERQKGGKEGESSLV